MLATAQIALSNFTAFQLVSAFNAPLTPYQALVLHRDYDQVQERARNTLQTHFNTLTKDDVVRHFVTDLNLVLTQDKRSLAARRQMVHCMVVYYSRVLRGDHIAEKIADLIHQTEDHGESLDQDVKQEIFYMLGEKYPNADLTRKGWLHRAKVAGGAFVFALAGFALGWYSGLVTAASSWKPHSSESEESEPVDLGEVLMDFNIFDYQRAAKQESTLHSTVPPVTTEVPISQELRDAANQQITLYGSGVATTTSLGGALLAQAISPDSYNFYDNTSVLINLLEDPRTQGLPLSILTHEMSIAWILQAGGFNIVDHQTDFNDNTQGQHAKSVTRWADEGHSLVHSSSIGLSEQVALLPWFLLSGPNLILKENIQQIADGHLRALRERNQSSVIACPNTAHYWCHYDLVTGFPGQFTIGGYDQNGNPVGAPFPVVSALSRGVPSKTLTGDPDFVDGNSFAQPTWAVPIAQAAKNNSDLGAYGLLGAMTASLTLPAKAIPVGNAAPFVRGKGADSGVDYDVLFGFGDRTPENIQRFLQTAAVWPARRLTLCGTVQSVQALNPIVLPLQMPMTSYVGPPCEIADIETDRLEGITSRVGGMVFSVENARQRYTPLSRPGITEELPRGWTGFGAISQKHWSIGRPFVRTTLLPGENFIYRLTAVDASASSFTLIAKYWGYDMSAPDYVPVYSIGPDYTRLTATPMEPYNSNARLIFIDAPPADTRVSQGGITFSSLGQKSILFIGPHRFADIVTPGGSVERVPLGLDWHQGAQGPAESFVFGVGTILHFDSISDVLFMGLVPKNVRMTNFTSTFVDQDPETSAITMSTTGRELAATLQQFSAKPLPCIEAGEVAVTLLEPLSGLNVAAKVPITFPGKQLAPTPTFTPALPQTLRFIRGQAVKTEMRVSPENGTFVAIEPDSLALDGQGVVRGQLHDETKVRVTVADNCDKLQTTDIDVVPYCLQQGGEYPTTFIAGSQAYPLFASLLVDIQSTEPGCAPSTVSAYHLNMSSVPGQIAIAPAYQSNATLTGNELITHGSRSDLLDFLSHGLLFHLTCTPGQAAPMVVDFNLEDVDSTSRFASAGIVISPRNITRLIVSRMDYTGEARYALQDEVLTYQYQITRQPYDTARPTLTGSASSAFEVHHDATETGEALGRLTQSGEFDLRFIQENPCASPSTSIHELSVRQLSVTQAQAEVVVPTRSHFPLLASLFSLRSDLTQLLVNVSSTFGLAILNTSTLIPGTLAQCRNTSVMPTFVFLPTGGFVACGPTTALLSLLNETVWQTSCNMGNVTMAVTAGDIRGVPPGQTRATRIREASLAVVAEPETQITIGTVEVVSRTRFQLSFFTTGRPSDISFNDSSLEYDAVSQQVTGPLRNQSRVVRWQEQTCRGSVSGLFSLPRAGTDTQPTGPTSSSEASFLDNTLYLALTVVGISLTCIGMIALSIHLRRRGRLEPTTRSGQQREPGLELPVMPSHESVSGLVPGTTGRDMAPS